MHATCSTGHWLLRGAGIAQPDRALASASKHLSRKQALFSGT
jgi:hypothetical protein